MKYLYIVAIGIMMTVRSVAQPTVTDIYFPKYIQGAGTFSTADDRRVPFAFRVRISGLNPNSTYRYYNRFLSDPTSTNIGDGNFILVKQSGSFVRATTTSFTNSTRYGEFLTNATGAYEGWFIGEPSQASTFLPATQLYARITLNDGNGGTTAVHYLTSNNFATVINFGTATSDGTGLQSTAATQGHAKNFVMLYDNAEGTGQPIAATFIEADGTANTTANFYAAFYANNVNEVDKTWGVIIPNNLAGGIKRIVQYSLVDGTQVGYKTSEDGTWAKDGGGTVSTVNTIGGWTRVSSTAPDGAN